MDWIEEAEQALDNMRWHDEWKKEVIERGIEEVRALRKERDELKEKEANNRHWAINEIYAQNSKLRCREEQNLRDEFAKEALPKILEEHKGLGTDFDTIAELSYLCAKRMMEARNK